VTSTEGEDRVAVSPAEGDGPTGVPGGQDVGSAQVVPSDAAAEPSEAPEAAEAGAAPETFIGPRGPRWRVESVFVRIVATSGIVGISVALAAILGTQAVAYWITGLVVALVSVILAAVLWSSRTL
jgi:hypothetical protein